VYSITKTAGTARDQSQKLHYHARCTDLVREREQACTS
jgi:hypothetical protein